VLPATASQVRMLTLGFHCSPTSNVLAVTQLFETCASLGVCAGTRFRFATPEDAPLLHTLNRVNDAFVCWQVRCCEFHRNLWSSLTVLRIALPRILLRAISAKNEFVLLAVRDVPVQHSGNDCG